MDVLFTYRKIVITQGDLSFIREVIDNYRSKGRSFISHKLFEAWDWRQANDQLKDGVCHGHFIHLVSDFGPGHSSFHFRNANKKQCQPAKHYV